MNKEIKESIKVTLNVINNALKQLPNDKRLLVTSRISQVLNKYQTSMASKTELQKFEQELRFNLNFIKLSNPTLDYKLPEEEPKRNEEVGHDDFVEFQRLKEDVFDTQQEREKNVRQEVEFSNWFDGNVDPQLLNKHKGLLERQHFSGQYWKDKEKPRSPTKEYLKSVIGSETPLEMPEKTQELKDSTPSNFEQGDQFWEKVKR